MTGILSARRLTNDTIIVTYAKLCFISGCQRERVRTCTCGGAVAVKAITALG